MTSNVYIPILLKKKVRENKGILGSRCRFLKPKARHCGLLITIRKKQ